MVSVSEYCIFGAYPIWIVEAIRHAQQRRSISWLTREKAVAVLKKPQQEKPSIDPYKVIARSTNSCA